MTSVRRPSSARQAPRLIVVVVLPTPPFWLATAITRGSGRPVGTSSDALGAATASSGTAHRGRSLGRAQADRTRTAGAQPACAQAVTGQRIRDVSRETSTTWTTGRPRCFTWNIERRDDRPGLSGADAATRRSRPVGAPRRAREQRRRGQRSSDVVRGLADHDDPPGADQRRAEAQRRRGRAEARGHDGIDRAGTMPARASAGVDGHAPRRDRRARVGDEPAQEVGRASARRSTSMKSQIGSILGEHQPGQAAAGAEVDDASPVDAGRGRSTNAAACSTTSSIGRAPSMPETLRRDAARRCSAGSSAGAVGRHAGQVSWQRRRRRGGSGPRPRSG